jgi:hypothetical protein
VLQEVTRKGKKHGRKRIVEKEKRKGIGWRCVQDEEKDLIKVGWRVL